MFDKIYVHNFKDIPYFLYKKITINSELKDQLGNTKIFDFSVRVMNVFNEKKINNLSDILQISEKEYLELNKFGRQSLREVNGLLDGLGLRILKSKNEVRKFFLTKQRRVLTDTIEELKELLSAKNFIDR